MNDLPKLSTEGARSLMKRFVRSLSVPHELLMSMRSFFKHGQVGNWLRQANSVTCKFLSSPDFIGNIRARRAKRKNVTTV